VCNVTTNRVAILGVFVADTTYRAERLPRMGETILGRSFALGPGGKGSNQAVAAARLGAEVGFITRLGEDPFAEMALKVWAEAGVRPAVIRVPESYTGAACIFVEHGSGENAIVICPGAAATITPDDLDAHAGLIAGAAAFVTQLEQPLDAAVRGLEIARANAVATILNPAPGRDLSDAVLALCDYLTPNETEAEALTGLAIGSLDDARAVAERLRQRGVGTVVMTLGEKGALLHGPGRSEVVPALTFGPVVETTGAGDAFNGGFATGLARGMEASLAVRFGCAAAGISVTRAGAAASMPTLAEVETLLAREGPGG
jgi:ribokinase